jgi:hypothetical protein
MWILRQPCKFARNNNALSKEKLIPLLQACNQIKGVFWRFIRIAVRLDGQFRDVQGVDWMPQLVCCLLVRALT